MVFPWFEHNIDENWKKKKYSDLVIFLFFREFFLPTPIELYSMKNPKSNKTIHQIAYMFFIHLLKLEVFSIVFQLFFTKRTLNIVFIHLHEK